MTERHKNPTEAAVEQFLQETPEASVAGSSLSASVPLALKAILREISTSLIQKAPDRVYTAYEIAKIARIVYSNSGMIDEDWPIILENMRAFGRYLQKRRYQETGFLVSGRVNNRRTYKPISREQSSLDT